MRELDVKPKEHKDIDRRTYTDGKEEEIKERLQGLGYLD